MVKHEQENQGIEEAKHAQHLLSFPPCLAPAIPGELS
jgi:hypothetical protein